MQSRGWTASADRGNRWRDRERNDTHYTQNHTCERGGEGRAETARGGIDGIRKTGRRLAEKENLESELTVPGKSQSNSISVVIKEGSFEKQLNTFSFNV